MMRHRASWHKSCHLKFNQTQLKRLERKSVEDHNSANTTAAISISQLLIFNSVKHARAADASLAIVQHKRERETPLPLYITMKIHAVTSKRNIIDTLFHWGIAMCFL